MNNEKIYKALIKVNDIGKKLTDENDYVLYNGMMIGYHKEDKTNERKEVAATGLGVTFIDNKVQSDLEGLNFIPLLIDGKELYQANKHGTFERFEVSDEYVTAVFNVEMPDNNDFIPKFREYVYNNHKSEEYLLKIYNDIEPNLTNEVVSLDKDEMDDDYIDPNLEYIDGNLILYRDYILYTKSYKPGIYTGEHKVNMEILYMNNRIIKKSNKVISEINKLNIVDEYDATDMVENLLSNDSPTKITMDNDFSILIMKSLCRTLVKKSTLYFRLTDTDDDGISYFIITVSNKFFDTVNVYKVIKCEL